MGRQGLRWPRPVPASPGARTHVLPPEGSARLSSCLRLAGAGLGPHAWSGLLSPGAPSPRRRSPHAAGAACQPLPPPRPNLGLPGPPHHLLSSYPAQEPGQRLLRLLRLRESRRRRRGDGAPRGTSAFGTRTLSVPDLRPRRQVRRRASSGSLARSPPGTAARDTLWAGNLSGRVASLTPFLLRNSGRRSFSSKVV